MLSAIDRLRTLAVRDVMNRQVVTISANSTMADAGDVLRCNDISGAPVIDEKGHLVGVLAAADFLPESNGGKWTGHVVQELMQDFPGGPYHVEEHVERLVSEFMSPAVQTVDPGALLVQAARCLCIEHIHRVIVVDDEVRPIGILTSLDIVAAMVNVIEEESE